MSTVFGMVSTRQSRRFTPVATESFFRYTPFNEDDEFLLIDNDGSLDGPPPQATFVVNPTPQGFATNMNTVLRRAHERHADAVLLNNDLVFTTDWFGPLAVESAAVVSPVSNAQLPFEAGGFKAQEMLDLADYVGHEGDLERIAATNRAQRGGYFPVHCFAFFCAKIPFAVIDAVGFLDETFGNAGAEDKDYCIRTLLAGFEIRFAVASYVLHFQGRSTWRGGETQEETYRRNEVFARHFLDKWGEPLFRLFVLQHSKALSTPELRQAWEAGQYRPLVEALLPKHRSGPTA